MASSEIGGMIKCWNSICKVGEANVDTYTFVESFIRWIQALEVSNCESGSKNSRSLEWEVEGGVDFGFEIEDYLLPNLVL